MEDIGSAYAIILNNPELRAGLIAEAERSQRFSRKSRGPVRLRFGLAHALRALAARIQPNESGPSQPVLVESAGQS
jgi:hypothetical protein